MTRDGEQRIRFGIKEWVTVGSLIFLAGGAWVDMSWRSSSHATAIFRLESKIDKISDDHETRIRAIEHAEKSP